MDRGWNGVSFIQYVQLSVFNNTYKLATIGVDSMVTSKNMYLTVNNIQRNPPYNDIANGISIQNIGDNLQLTTNFGLVSLTFGGPYSAQLSLDGRYGTFLCGLFGNGDGNAPNDFSDRSGTIVPLVGDVNTQYFKWGSNWKADSSFYPLDDKSIDIDKSM